MIYQRHIPPDELITAELELLLQQGWRATFWLHLCAVITAVMLFWPFMAMTTLLLCFAAFVILLVLRSWLMSSALVHRRYQSHRQRVYWQLLIGTALTGLVWSGAYIFAAQHVPVTLQYVFLLVIVMIAVFSLSFSVIVREYYLVYVFASLWPIAWWSLVHYLDQPYNLHLGLLLLALCAVLISVSQQTYSFLRTMISQTWEREHITQELGDITGHLRDRNRQLRDARRQLTDLANVDELTGVGNRRLVNKVLQEEINRARRGGAELSMIMLDVDCFKNYNDEYGHPAGDIVLQKLADIMLRVSTRAGELVARYGGEEFILLLPGASEESALRTASRLKDMIAQERIPHAASVVADYVTVSQGVATVRPDAEHLPADLIQRADKALYRAKGAGRNTIAIE